MLIRKQRYLDLQKNTVIGYQDIVSNLRVGSIVKGIRNGDNIKAVYLYKTNKHTYQLTSMKNSSGFYLGGGHHRLGAFFITTKLLPYILIEKPKEKDENQLYLSSMQTDSCEVENILVVNDELFFENQRFDNNKTRYLKYRPLSIEERIQLARINMMKLKILQDKNIFSI